MLRRDTRVFISAVTRDLRSVRELVRSAIAKNEWHAVEQTEFHLDYREVSEKLARLIEGCDAVVHIAGLAYGAEPISFPQGSQRMSYTQLEYHVARRLNKPIYTFIAAEDFPYDKPDPAFGPQPESEEVLELQRRHRLALAQTGRDFAQVPSPERLLEEIRGLRIKVELLADELLSVDEKVDSLKGDVAKAGERQEELHRETTGELRRIGDTLELMLDASGAAATRALMILGTGPTGQSGAAPQPVFLTDLQRVKVQQVVNGFNGAEVDSQRGIHVFHRPIEALACAFRLRALLDKHAAPSTRFIIHMGEVFLRNAPGQMFGRGARIPEVDLVSQVLMERLLAAASPGQTFLTRGASDLISRSSSADMSRLLPADVELASHGRYYLPGMQTPEEIFGAGRPGIDSMQRPAESANSRRAFSPEEEALHGWRPLPGALIPNRPNWKLSTKIGEGGFGQAWIAEHKTGGRHVLKFCFDMGNLRALKREVATLRALRENEKMAGYFVHVIEWNLESPPHYVELEHYPLGSLVDYGASIGGIRAISLLDRIKLMVDAARAIEAAHELHIIHRDIKPSNILVERASGGAHHARMGDFGISAIGDRAIFSQKGITAGGFTTAEGEKNDDAAGTALYRAPELTLGSPATYLTDIYAFGVTLFQTSIGDFHKGMGQGWEDLLKISSLSNLIALCVHMEPRMRIQDMATVRAALERIVEDPSQLSPDSHGGWAVTAGQRKPGLLRRLWTKLRYGSTYVWSDRRKVRKELTSKEQIAVLWSRCGKTVGFLYLFFVANIKLFAFAAVIAVLAVIGYYSLPKGHGADGSRLKIAKNLWSQVLSTPSTEEREQRAEEREATKQRDVAYANQMAAAGLPTPAPSPAPMQRFGQIMADPEHAVFGGSADRYAETGFFTAEQEDMYGEAMATPAPKTAPEIPPGERVALKPASPVRTKPLMIVYQTPGGPLENQAPIYIEVGYQTPDGLKRTRQTMVRRPDALWEFQVTVPARAQAIRIAFTEQPKGYEGIWDKNQAAGWTFQTVAPE